MVFDLIPTSGEGGIARDAGHWNHQRRLTVEGRSRTGVVWTLQCWSMFSEGIPSRNGSYVPMHNRYIVSAKSSGPLSILMAYIHPGTARNPPTRHICPWPDRCSWLELCVVPQRRSGRSPAGVWFQLPLSRGACSPGYQTTAYGDESRLVFSFPLSSHQLRSRR